MSNAKAMGKLAARMPADERECFMATKIKAIEVDRRTQKKQLELNGQVLTRKEQEYLSEIHKCGGLSRTAVKQHIYFGLYCLFFILLSVPLEAYLAYRTFILLNFGQTFAFIGAIGSVAISLKIIDQVINWYRKNHPAGTDRIMQIFASLSMIALILVILCFAEIRGQVNMFGSELDDNTTLEDQVKNADSFYGGVEDSFNYLMVAMTAAIVFSTGLALHEAHHRLALALPMSRLYRKLDRVRKQMTGTAQKINTLDQWEMHFKAEFEESLALEQIKLQNKQSSLSWRQRGRQGVARLITYLWHPLTLIVLGISIFFILKGQAHGTHWEIELDLSKSVLPKGYAGKVSVFDQNVQAVDQIIRNQLKPGDRIKVVGITEDSFGKPYILLDHRLTQEKGAFGEKVAREKLALLKQWQELSLKATAKATDILGALFLSSHSMADTKEAKVLVVLSDMRNYSQVLDIESPGLINVTSALSKVEKAGAIPDLNGVRVLCLGVHGYGKTPDYWQGLKDFWQKLFQKAGATDFVFSMERRVNNE